MYNKSFKFDDSRIFSKSEFKKCGENKHNVFIKNTTALNQNLINSFIHIEPWSKRIGDDTEKDYAKIASQINGTYIIQNDFNLQNN